MQLAFRKVREASYGTPRSPAQFFNVNSNRIMNSRHSAILVALAAAALFGAATPLAKALIGAM
ncbi:MAG: hypothetical protein IOC33_16780, partial [Burkholderia sp.]|nr:hypothetical protein [Burkholderia sp.]